MNNKKNLVTAAALTFLVVFVLSVTILATATSGTQADPLVTLSYLNNQYKPGVLNELSAALDVKMADLTYETDTKIESLRTELEAMNGGGTDTQSDTPVETMSVISLSNGQTVTCSVGAEIMPRIGTVSAKGSVPALVNTTAGETVSDGTPLASNNLYIVTIEGNGIVATSGNVKVLIKGSYIISG